RNPGLLEPELLGRHQVPQVFVPGLSSNRVPTPVARQHSKPHRPLHPPRGLLGSPSFEKATPVDGARSYIQPDEGGSQCPSRRSSSCPPPSSFGQLKCQPSERRLPSDSCPRTPEQDYLKYGVLGLRRA